MKKPFTVFVAALAAVCVLASTNALALDPGPKCEASQLGTSGKYVSCRLKADSKAVKTGDPADYSKCNLDKVTAAEDKAGPGVCPNTSDLAALQAYLDQCAQGAAAALAGGELPPDPALCDEALVACEGDLQTCQSATCGNGVLEAGEDCEVNWAAEEILIASQSNCAGEGFDAGTLACGAGCVYDTSDCRNQVCGDGFVDDPEQCDDGNVSNTDACLASCVPASCGDGFVRSGVEQCDDGNASNTDACLASCVTASCGDGFVRSGVEQCDDGNASNTDACLASCVPAACGDGFVRSGVEQCDGSNLDGQTCQSAGFSYGTLACGAGCVYDTSDCRNQQVCGDGFVDGPEECDDGNLVDGDECTSSCQSRFVDNDDGTITDIETGLVWEKKSDNGDIHDKDNLYTWSADNGLYNPDGTAYTVFLPALNNSNFAGHNDWRLPTIEELQTLIASPGPLYTYPIFKDGAVVDCDATSVSCSWTRSVYYWSSTQFEYIPSFAWYAIFGLGTVSGDPKTDSYAVRAVRAGS